MARASGPYSVAFPVNFTSKGDTTRDAFKKHMDEIARIYGILTDFDKDVANAEGITGQLTNHINSTNPHPSWTLKPSWGNVTGKPTNLLTTDSTISASKVSGALTNATIASGKVTGLEAFVKSLLPSDDGDDTSGGGITSSSLSSPGYAKFGNGLIIQWGTARVEKSSASDQGAFISFPTSFSSSCFSVITSVSNADSAYSYSDVGTVATLSRSSPTQTGFEAVIAPPNRCAVTVFYIAIGV